MKTTLVKLSICACGFHVLHDDIQVGREYTVDPHRTLPATMICGGCGAHIPVLTIFAAGWDGRPGGYLPVDIFDLPEFNQTQLTA